MLSIEEKINFLCKHTSFDREYLLERKHLISKEVDEAYNTLKYTLEVLEDPNVIFDKLSESEVGQPIFRR